MTVYFLDDCHPLRLKRIGEHTVYPMEAVGEYNWDSSNIYNYIECVRRIKFSTSLIEKHGIDDSNTICHISFTDTFGGVKLNHAQFKVKFVGEIE